MGWREPVSTSTSASQRDGEAEAALNGAAGGALGVPAGSAGSVAGVWPLPPVSAVVSADPAGTRGLRSGSRDTRAADGRALRVLVVDDETVLAELLTMALRYEGWEVAAAGTGSAALRMVDDFQPDAVVLDIMLPDMDGLAVLRGMRSVRPDIPVLFLTAKDAVEDRVLGLTAGGDDYVTKPFSIEELAARLRGLMRRVHGTVAARRNVLSVGDLTLDEDSREVYRDGVEIHLTATEFELLRYLMRNPRRVLSKAQILDRVWNYDFGGQANVVELYVSYLRKKIDAGRQPMIHTMRGAGYVLRPASAPAGAVKVANPAATG